MSQLNRPSRRQFIKQAAALGTTCLGVPYFVPARALAAPGRPGANDRIGVGYIGCGRRSAQLRDLPTDGRIVAAADCNLTRAEAVAERYGASAWQDYRQLLDQENVDAVVIATPDHWHALPSIHACEAGKDVYVEKPMTLTVREGRLMVAAGRKYDRVVQVGSQQRSTAANRVGCEFVRSGQLGKIHTVYAANYPGPWECALPAQTAPSGLDWDMWCGPAPPVAYHEDIYTPRANPGWISFRPWSGGEMTGWGAHGLDQIQWALNMDVSGPVEIWTEGPRYAPPVYSLPESQERGDRICRQPSVVMRYENDVVVKFSKGDPGGGTFVGEHGTLEISRGRCTVSPSDLAESVFPNGGKLVDGSENHMQNWFDAMRSRTRPAADVEIGHRSTTVCHLANIARWLGRRLRWDPQQEIFPGDDEANALLDRSRRKPYQLPEHVS